jgi:hypothetical protein
MSEKEINEQTEKEQKEKQQKEKQQKEKQQKEKSKTDFKKIIVEFCKDLLTTFPELQENFDDDLIHLLKNTDNDESLTRVYEYCKSVFPERFFDILYQNKDIFTNHEINTKFLPGIEFKELWKCEITDTTRETMWKYLQLILFSIVSNISDGDSFGDTAKLFESINEDEFKSKLEETINSMKNMFEDSNINLNDPSGINLDELPDPKQMHDHISGMMDGKLGKLAREIAEETAAELNIDPENMTDANGYFKNMFKNPGKLMGLVKNVGDKLDKKIKSGELKESELIEEASELVKKMRDMPGMENIQSMLGKMGMPNMAGFGGRNAKVNMGAVQSQLDKNLKLAKTKERMKQRLNENQTNVKIEKTSISKEEEEKEAAILKLLNSGKDGDIENLIFSTGEKVEKSARPQPSSNNKKKNKKKKD